MSLRRFGHSWRDVDAFLETVAVMTAKTAHKWSKILVNRDFDEYINEERGGKRDDTFRDCYPDLKLENRQFVSEECSKKEASFIAESLAKFVDDRFYEFNDIKTVDQRHIRSIESCRLDLRRCGAKFTTNAARPYFLQHEREDVVKDPEEFVKYVAQNEHHFYTTPLHFVPQWKISTFNPIIIICLYCFSVEFFED
jgi:hypothetical protein